MTALNPDSLEATEALAGLNPRETLPMIIDLWNQTPQEIQAALLVLAGTILATLVSARAAKANAKEERISEIRHLVSLVTDRAVAMGVLTS